MYSFYEAYAGIADILSQLSTFSPSLCLLDISENLGAFKKSVKVIRMKVLQSWHVT